MSRKVVQTTRNEYILVYIERRRDPLHKHMCDVVVSVRPTVELSPESPLPLLGLRNIVSVGRVKDKSLELELADARKPASDLEIQISIGFI